MARPTKLTPDVQERIVQALTAGNYLQTAATYAGIGITTLHRWMQQGEQARRGMFREFREAVEKAQADAEVRDIALIATAAATHWQAAAWRLERKFPERWGRRVVDVRGDSEMPIKIVVEYINDWRAAVPPDKRRVELVPVDGKRKEHAS